MRSEASASVPLLHGVSAAAYVRKVRIVLEEKALPYQLEHVMPMTVGPEFRKKSPLGQIPLYEDGDLLIPDSSAICAYLEKIQPEPALYPADPARYGRALWYEEYSDTRLMESLDPIFHERIVHVRVLKQPANEESIARHLEEMLPPCFDYLEEELALAPGAARGAIVGDAFSIADVAIASTIVNLMHAGESIDARRWPNLAGWFDAVCSRPVLAKLIAEERASLDAL